MDDLFDLLLVAFFTLFIFTYFIFGDDIESSDGFLIIRSVEIKSSQFYDTTIWAYRIKDTDYGFNNSTSFEIRSQKDLGYQIGDTVWLFKNTKE